MSTNKTLVINNLKSKGQESYCQPTWCKWWGSVDNFERKVSEKKAHERKLLKNLMPLMELHSKMAR